jgi:hypothetical protein
VNGFRKISGTVSVFKVEQEASGYLHEAHIKGNSFERHVSDHILTALNRCSDGSMAVHAGIVASPC